MVERKWKNNFINKLVLLLFAFAGEGRLRKNSYVERGHEREFTFQSQLGEGSLNEWRSGNNQENGKIAH